MIQNIKNIPENLRNDVEQHTRKNGDVIFLNKDWNHCYVGDYKTIIRFCKMVTYSYPVDSMRTCMQNTIYGELEKVLDLLSSRSSDGEIFCYTTAGDFERRKKQSKNSGIKLLKITIDQIKANIQKWYS